MASRCKPNGVGIVRVHNHPGDRLSLPEADISEGISAIGRLVDSCPKRRTLTVISLAGPNVYDVRIGRRYRYRPDRMSCISVEDRLKSCSVVDGPP